MYPTYIAGLRRRRSISGIATNNLLRRECQESICQKAIRSTAESRNWKIWTLCWKEEEFKRNHQMAGIKVGNCTYGHYSPPFSETETESASLRFAANSYDGVWEITQVRRVSSRHSKFNFWRIYYGTSQPRNHEGISKNSRIIYSRLSTHACCQSTPAHFLVVVDASCSSRSFTNLLCLLCPSCPVL